MNRVHCGLRSSAWTATMWEITPEILGRALLPSRTHEGCAREDVDHRDPYSYDAALSRLSPASLFFSHSWTLRYTSALLGSSTPNPRLKKRSSPSSLFRQFFLAPLTRDPHPHGHVMCKNASKLSHTEKTTNASASPLPAKTSSCPHKTNP